MKDLLLIIAICTSITCLGQDNIAQGTNTSDKQDSTTYYKGLYLRTLHNLSNHKHGLDSINKSLQEEIKNISTKNKDFIENIKSLANEVSQSKEKLKAYKNSIDSLSTRISQLEKSIVSLELVIIDKDKEILELNYKLSTLKNISTEEKNKLRTEKEDAIKKLNSTIAEKKDFQKKLEIIIGKNAVLMGSLKSENSLNTKLKARVDSVAEENLVAQQSITNLKNISEQLKKEKSELMKESSTLLIALFVGIAFIVVIFFYIIFKILKPDGIEKRRDEILKQLKVYHPMLKETITHYLNYKLYSGIMKTALILVASTTIILMAGVVAIYYLAPETNKLIGDGFWEVLSSVIAPLVVTITIFSALEQKKIDTAKTLLEHSSVNPTSIT